MRTFARSDRVGVEIQRVISELLQKNVKDPRLKLATITGVKMSRDLKSACIFFVNTGAQTSVEDALAGFRSATGFFKRSLSRLMELRYMPAIEFRYDPSFDYGSRIDALLNSVKREYGSDRQPPQE